MMMMNNLFKNIFAISCITMCLLMFSPGCKYLDVAPDNLLTSDMLWETRANAEGYLNQIYGQVVIPTDDYTTLGASDETSCSIQGVNVRKMIAGNWNAQSNYWYYWGGNYAGIRQSIVFEQNIDKMADAIIGADLKKQYKAEAIFLRGWFYWKLLRQYGPFVKITGVLSLNDDYNKYPRAPFDECVAYINELLDRAAADLPSTWSASSNYGRATKASCLAVKSQVTLWAASPLWNGNPKLSGLKNNDGTALAPLQYDISKWRVAANAAKAVIDVAGYKLFTNLDEGDTQFDPYLSFRNLFLTNWNNEILFSSNNQKTSDSWHWGYEARCSPKPGGYDMQNATQNVVDAFYMRNGRTIDDPLSQYTETGFVQSDDPANWGRSRDGLNRGYVKGNSNMYVNREARFYVSIQYNGKAVLPAPTLDDRNFFSSDANKDGTGRAEFYYSGKSGVGVNNNSDITGYDVLKNVSPAGNARTSSTVYRPYIHLRLAEMYLNYAEALNEIEPNHPDILKYLNLVRQRAGIPDLQTVYPAAVGNKDVMRKYILQERQVELAFEGDRYFTLIRRLMMGDVKVQSIYRMNTIASDGNQGFAFADFNKRILLQTRVWTDKMYLFPIAQSDRDKNSSLVQNPGW
uniref:RagB/SusD family nutrient uptake outer membrane protein n=1 Tax=Pedobacter schmidteae TaxID=2201271 RepID=UPI0018D562CE|nr:RagB/SusD family nutrient uptake outer membrane protein [Pedobacter schmidteae]